MNIGALATSLYPPQVASRMAERQATFQQLGQDLQSTDLEAAQQDFVKLTQSLPGSKSATQSQSPIAQEWQHLGQDLQAGDASAAQADYVHIQQMLQRAHHAHRTVQDGVVSTGSGLIHFLTNAASAAASAYGSAGLTTLSAGSSLLSALA